MVAVLLEAFAYLFPDGSEFFFCFAVGGYLFNPFVFVVDIDDSHHTTVEGPVQDFLYAVHQVGMHLEVVGQQIAPADRYTQG